MNVHVSSADRVCYSEITAQPASNVSWHPLAWFRPCISANNFLRTSTIVRIRETVSACTWALVYIATYHKQYYGPHCIMAAHI